VGDARIKVIAMELAFAVRAQWGMVAVTACPWRVQSPDGTLDVLRIPDVLAGSLPHDHPGPFTGSPELVAEVWSPADGYDQVQRARAEYWLGGAGVLVEADVEAGGQVRVEWYTRNPAGGWTPQAAAAGESELLVLYPRPFSVVANRLLRPSAEPAVPLP
jgi:hypothetical protein